MQRRSLRQTLRRSLSGVAPSGIMGADSLWHDTLFLSKKCRGFKNEYVSLSFSGCKKKFALLIYRQLIDIVYKNVVLDDYLYQAEIKISELENLEQWADRIMDAENIEEVFGRRQ